MSEPTDPWHFARPELAQAYLQGFDLGLTSARGLFARRRMGKSEFLKYDLLPAAMRAGYLAAYTNLWDDTEHPGQALATAIVLATQPKGLGNFWEDLNRPIGKIRALPWRRGAWAARWSWSWPRRRRPRCRPYRRPCWRPTKPKSACFW